MSSLRFLQISDLHLNSALSGSKLALPPQKRAQINRDIGQALQRAVRLARDEKVDVVLCPGDLWDDESVSLDAATLIYDQFASLDPIPVLIAPGNHDPYNAASYHHPAWYRAKVNRPHPPNVHVFDQPRIHVITLPQLPSVQFYGCCFEENRPRRERVLDGLRPESDDSLNVLLLHGSQDDIIAPDANALLTAPFSRPELLACSFDYIALGHYHRYSAILDDAGRIRAAYGGIPVARSLDETGEHYVLIGEIEQGGLRADSLKKVHLDPRRILRVQAQVDSTITNSAAARERVEAALEAASVGKEDIVYVELNGRTHPEIASFDFDPAWCDSRCFHLVVDQTRLEPEYDIDALLADEASQKRIDGRFAARMKTLLAEAQDDPEKQKILRAALCYGLDALNGREVKPRNVY